MPEVGFCNDAERRLRPLRPDDEALLKCAVARWNPRSVAYEHSWGYIVQATRNQGAVWSDEAGGLVFFGRKPDSPETLVVPTFFADPPRLGTAVREVQTSFGADRTIVKNVDPTDVDRFRPFGFHAYEPHEGWSPSARSDDQTDPQMLVDLDELMAADGRRYRKLRKQLSLGRARDYRMRTYTDADRSAVLALCATRDLDQPDTRFSDAHTVYVESELQRVVFEENGRCVGFVAWCAISGATAALCAGIFLRGRRALGVWGRYQVMSRIHESGFRTVNLGGSEHIGGARFKELHFRPRSRMYRTHLVHDGE